MTSAALAFIGVTGAADTAAAAALDSAAPASGAVHPLFIKNLVNHSGIFLGSLLNATGPGISTVSSGFSTLTALAFKFFLNEPHSAFALATLSVKCFCIFSAPRSI